MSHPAAISSTWFPKIRPVWSEGGSKADIFVNLLITCVNGSGAYRSLSGLAKQSKAEQLIPPEGQEMPDSSNRPWSWLISLFIRKVSWRLLRTPTCLRFLAGHICASSLASPPPSFPGKPSSSSSSSSSPCALGKWKVKDAAVINEQ